MHSRNLQIAVAWILLASLFMGMALWQAQVSVNREAARKHEVLGPLANTRHAVRPVPAVSNIDPVADYIARCEKGMTVQEIRWALTDFENVGLAVGHNMTEWSEARVSTYRKTQRRWYLSCLVEGLNLSREQEKQALGAMRRLSRQEYESHREFLAKTKTTEREQARDLTATVEGIDLSRISLGIYFRNATAHSYMPWILCKLTASQERVTWKWFDLVIRSWPDSNEKHESRDQREINNPQDLTERTGGPLFLLPAPIDQLAVNCVTPLLALQKIDFVSNYSDPFREANPAEGRTFLKDLQLLHPVQLKMGFLLDKNFVGKVREALENSDL